MKMAVGNTRYVRRTISGDWTCCASSVEVLFGGRTSPLRSENITLNISPVRSARPSSVLRIATMSMKAKFIATITTQRNLRSDATGARQQS